MAAGPKAPELLDARAAAAVQADAADPAVVKAALASDEVWPMEVEVPGYLGGRLAFYTL